MENNYKTSYEKEEKKNQNIREKEEREIWSNLQSLNEATWNSGVL